MNVKYSYLKAALFTVAAFLFLIPVTLQASCYQCVCATDDHCDATGSCENFTANCTRQEFTASCTGTYHIRAETACESSACHKCRSCVTIFKISNGEIEIGGCHSVDCRDGDCDYICDVELTQGVTYALYVCLGYCPLSPSVTCEDCAEDCEAIGCIYYGFSGSNCNP